MATKNYKCPHCSSINEVNVQSWDESFTENLPTNIVKAILVTAAGAATAGAGAAILGSIFAAEGVYSYMNGTAVKCGSCKRVFKI